MATKMNLHDFSFLFFLSPLPSPCPSCVMGIAWQSDSSDRSFLIAWKGFIIVTTDTIVKMHYTVLSNETFLHAADVCLVLGKVKVVYNQINNEKIICSL